MNLTDLQNYYSKLLIIQYAGQPKFQQFIQLVANQSLCDGLFLELQDCFHLDNAVGAQLTIIGKIVGVPRDVFGINPYASYFNFTRATTEPASNGFNRATTPIDTEYFMRAQTNYTYTLTDWQLLQLIYLKIIFNNTYSSWSALKEALFSIFNGAIDIVSPANNLNFFTFTRAAGTPASTGFNRATTPTDAYNFMRSADLYSGTYGSTLMQLSYIVRQPYYVVMTIAQFLKIVPHSSGVNYVVTQV